MSWKNHEIFYYKEVELKYLLSGLGITNIYGLFSEETEDIHMYQLLVGMYQKKMCESVEDNLVVLPPTSDFLTKLIQSKRCVLLQREMMGYPLRCCYLGENEVIVTEKSQREVNTIRVWQMTLEEWREFVFTEIEDEIYEMRISVHGVFEEHLHGKMIFREVDFQKKVFYEENGEMQQKEYQPQKIKIKLDEWIGVKK